MTTDSELITPEEISAFIDGELGPERHVRVEAAIAGSPALAAEIAGLRDDKARIARHFAPLIDLPVPDRLVRAVTDGARKQSARQVARMRPAWSMAIAAGLLLAVILGSGLQFMRERDPLVAAALAARQDRPSPGLRLADASLAGTIGAGLKIPDLGKAGFRLDSTRLVAARTVELRYMDASGRLFTVFLRHEGGADRFSLLRRGKLRVCIWQNDELAAVMVGEMSSSAMLRVASLTYADLNF